VALEIEGSNPFTHPIAHFWNAMFRLTTRLLLLAALTAVSFAACSDDDPAPQATGEATTTATAVVDPVPRLTAGLGDPVSREEAADGALVVRWVVDGPSAEGVASDLADRVGGIPGLTLTATELTERGSVIAFEGVRSGHYLVTRSTGQGTPVELRLDPIADSDDPPEATAVAMPDDFPAAEVPIFPDATIVGAERTDLGDGLVRFDLILESERAPLEVLGYYADLFGAAGWEVQTEPGAVEVHGSGRVTTVWVRSVPERATRSTLEVVLRGTEGAP
jgi:hypothetical protein